MATFKWRRTIMNKFRKFLGSISAETCLKWIILVINPPKSPSAGGVSG